MRLPGTPFLDHHIRQVSLLGVLIVCLIGAAVHAFRQGITQSVEYRPVPVLAVVPITGGDSWARVVTVDLGEGRRRNIRVRDPLIRVGAGGTACLREARVLLRRYPRRHLVLPGYCPTLHRARRDDGPAFERDPLSF